MQAKTPEYFAHFPELGEKAQAMKLLNKTEN